MTVGLIEKEWQYFRNEVIPKDASNVQLTEMRRAFYFGASVIMMLNNHIGGDDVPEEAGVRILATVSKELNEFMDAIQQDKA